MICPTCNHAMKRIELFVGIDYVCEPCEHGEAPDVGGYVCIDSNVADAMMSGSELFTTAYHDVEVASRVAACNGTNSAPYYVTFVERPAWKPSMLAGALACRAKVWRVAGCLLAREDG